MTTPLTIYRFGLRGNSANKSTRKHRFRTKKHQKVKKSSQKTTSNRFGYWRAWVLRRLASIVVERRGLTPSPTPCFARARQQKQLSTVSASLTRRFDQAKKHTNSVCFFAFYAQGTRRGSGTERTSGGFSIEKSTLLRYLP